MRATTIAAAFVMGLSSFARAQEPASSGVPPLPRGSVSGVVRSVTGEGLPHLPVRLTPKRRLGFGIPDALTDEDGTFRMTNIPEGAYQLELRVPGFDRFVYGADGRGGAADVVVREGRETAGLTFEVPAGGTIRGVVLRANGEPATHATVRVARRDERGDPTWVGAAAYVGDDGTFTLAPVKEGSWLIAVNERITAEMFVDDVIPIGNPSQQTWYPSTFRPDEALQVEVATGTVVNGIVVQIPGGPRRVISGVVLDEAGRTVPGVTLKVALPDPADFESGGGLFQQVLQPHGRFVIHAHASAPVTIRAAGQRDGHPVAAELEVDPDTLRNDLPLVLRPAAMVRGRVVVPPGENFPMMYRVMLNPAAYGLESPLDISQDGIFGGVVMPGPQRVSVWVDKSWRVESMTVDGRSITDQVDLRPGTTVEMVVRIAPGAP